MLLQGSMCTVLQYTISHTSTWLSANERKFSAKMTVIRVITVIFIEIMIFLILGKLSEEKPWKRNP